MAIDSSDAPSADAANSSTPARLRSRIERFRQRLEAAPRIKVEESLLLRVLAQSLVLVGIAATDIAAATEMSLWAIPLSILGAYWSWRRRHQRNIAAKFCIAIGMLVALAAFFVGLRAELNDTRLVLAELLVQLQVLHSFDLPRRKDLGYSMIIGLILLGVASTLSQTMVFGLLLLLFLAIALPVLVLDYRSRLELLGRQHRSPLHGIGFSRRRLGGFFVIILGLGLAIFALLPRLPGYQLRTFPVSQPIALEESFDNTQITNPGYVSNGKGKGSGPAQGQGDSSEKMDEDFYYGFNDRINQNLRGQLKPKVVMRVRSQAEGFWQVVSFDRYLGQGWEISRNNQAKTVKRPSWSYQFYLPRNVLVGRTKEVIQTYTVVADLPNLIPAMPYAKELYFPTQEVGIDPEGTLRSPLNLRENMTYTVISDVPYRDRSRLNTAPTNYSANIRNYYLDVPAKIRDKVRRRTQELLATSPQPLTTPYEQSLFLAQALKQRYSLQPELPALKPKEDLVEAFLFQSKGGYPDHFSTALTIMLRSIGIPARLTAGFGSGKFNPFTGLYEVQNTDAYTVTEVYFPRSGWFSFDPIPGHGLFPPSIEDDQTFGVLQQFWQWVAGWLPSPVTGWLNGVFGAIAAGVVFAVAWLLGLFSQGWMGLFTALLLAIGLSFLGWLSWLGWRSWRYRRWLGQLPPMERLYQQMVQGLTHQGFPKHPAQTPLEYAHQVQPAQSDLRAAAIAEISQAYILWRYGGQSPNLAHLKQRLRQVQRRDRARDLS
jgi:protein-glutamine gamma-glutamyltransferase